MLESSPCRDPSLAENELFLSESDHFGCPIIVPITAQPQLSSLSSGLPIFHSSNSMSASPHILVDISAAASAEAATAAAAPPSSSIDDDHLANQTMSAVLAEDDTDLIPSASSLRISQLPTAASPVFASRRRGQPFESPFQVPQLPNSNPSSNTNNNNNNNQQQQHQQRVNRQVNALNLEFSPRIWNIPPAMKWIGIIFIIALIFTLAIFSDSNVNIILSLLLAFFAAINFLRCYFTSRQQRIQQQLSRLSNRNNQSSNSIELSSMINPQEILSNRSQNHSTERLTRSQAIQRFLSNRSLQMQLLQTLRRQAESQMSFQEALGSSSATSQISYRIQQYQRHLQQIIQLLNESSLPRQHAIHPFGDDGSSTGFSETQINEEIGGAHLFSELKVLLSIQKEMNPERSNIEADAENDICVVCLEHLNDDSAVRILKCFHYSHQSCLDAWLLKKRECPVCRRCPLDSEYNPHDFMPAPQVEMPEQILAQLPGDPIPIQQEEEA